jgi:catalase
MNVNRDGAMRHKITRGTVNYHPNRFDQLKYTPASEGGYAEFAQKVAGIKQRVRGEKFKEHYNQAQLFYNSLAPHEKTHLAAAISFELSHCDDPQVFEGYTRLLNNVDFELAKEVAANVGGVVPDAPARPNKGQTSATLSQLAFAPKTPTIKSRRIAILVADGFNLKEVTALRALIKSASALSFVIGPRRGTIYAAGQKIGVGEGVWADHHYEGQRSTMFDAVIIPSGAEHGEKLSNNGRVIHWVREAFGHCKAIGAIGEGQYPFLSSR